MVVDTDHANGSPAYALEIDHEDVIVKNVKLEMLPIVVRRSFQSVLVPTVNRNAAMFLKFPDAVLQCVYYLNEISARILLAEISLR